MPYRVRIERPQDRWEVVYFQQQGRCRQHDKGKALPDVAALLALQKAPQNPTEGTTHTCARESGKRHTNSTERKASPANAHHLPVTMFAFMLYE
uniref:Uncharacterized protein n=1 Tax=Anopheles quadriannulatus TaxID=34691 RepID=A0A182XSR4_ANOQN